VDDECAPEPECDGACKSCDCGIPEYLVRNIEIVPFKHKNTHSWSCQVWKDYPTMKNPWGGLWKHGLIPRNFHVTFWVER
jgi:hypothetical protein